MAEFGENTLHPLQMVEARSAQHRASELQRNNSDAIASAHKSLAHAEFLYCRALTDRMKELRDEGMAVTVTERIAKGEASIAVLRKERDEKRGELAKLEQVAYRQAADRRALDGLVDWSMRRDLRVDVEPAPGDNVQTFGGRRAA